MNIPYQLYDHPIVREVIEDAYRRLEGWTITQHEACHDAKRLLTTGWDGVALMEILAEPLLELRGITDDDVALFETMVDERNYLLLNKTNKGAFYEAWDAERAASKIVEWPWRCFICEGGSGPGELCQTCALRHREAGTP